MLDVRPVGPEDLADLDRLFGGDEVADRCWCTWFIIPVAAFHEAGRTGNRATFATLVEESAHPLGLLARADGEPVGWCAVGPRGRFSRATRTPTLRGADRAEDDTVWLVPCFFVSDAARGQGVAKALLAAAVERARASGAVAVEGFPQAGDQRRTGGPDVMVGSEALFTTAGFEAVRRPSDKRVVVRLDLT